MGVEGLLMFLVYFFFSSRRRHTRCLSDWSSDVCSSDLPVSVESDAEDSHAAPIRAATVRVGFPDGQNDCHLSLSSGGTLRKSAGGSARLVMRAANTAPLK